MAVKLTEFEIPHLSRGRNTVGWITVAPITVNRTEAGAKKWHDAFFLQYGIKPPDLLHHCHGIRR